MKRVAIIYNYIHHYRVPLFNLLSRNKTIDYTIISGRSSEILIKKAAPELAIIKPSKGGINWKIIKNVWFFKRFLFQPHILHPSFFKKFDSFIYLGNMYYLSTWISAIIARVIGRKVIFWTHGFIRDENNFIGFIRSVFYKIPNELLVYGSRAKKILINKGFSAEKVTLIFNSLDFEKQDIFYEKKEIIKDLFVNQNLSIVGFIGRLTRQKKIHLLIELLHSMPKEKKFNLLIIGDGNQLTFLKRMVREFNLCEFVLFRGAVYDERENCNLISMMDVLISPGEVGLTAIHSMTYGTPVITHDRFDKQMPEYEVIIDGVTGDFFDYSNPIPSLKKLLPKYLYKKHKYTYNCRKIIKDKYNKENQMLIFNSLV